jgi:hypothetical protein
MFLGAKKKQTSEKISILASKPILIDQDLHKYKKEPLVWNKKETLFAVYLMNMTTNVRIWKALNPAPEGGNTNIIKTVLQANSPVRILSLILFFNVTHIIHF